MCSADYLTSCHGGVYKSTECVGPEHALVNCRDTTPAEQPWGTSSASSPATRDSSACYPDLSRLHEDTVTAIGEAGSAFQALFAPKQTDCSSPHVQPRCIPPDQHRSGCCGAHAMANSYARERFVLEPATSRWNGVVMFDVLKLHTCVVTHAVQLLIECWQMQGVSPMQVLPQ